MAICNSITAGAAIDCDNPQAGGVEDELVLINYSDWRDATFTFNGSNPLIIENIVLPSAKLGYLFTGINNVNKPNVEMVKKEFSLPLWKHSLDFVVFGNSPTDKKTVEELSKSKVVAIIKNNHKGASGNAAFEVYGNKAGLDLQTAKRNQSDDTQGTWQLNLATNDKALEDHVALTVFITSYAASKAVVDGLV